MTIGVTDFIKIKEVREEIDDTYPNPGDDITTKLSVSNSGYGHKLIGHAFEFLCRTLLTHRCTEIYRPQGNYVNGRFWGDDDYTDELHWGEEEDPPMFVRKYDRMRWEEYDNISSQKEWDERNENSPEWRHRSSIIWTRDEDLKKLVEQYVQTGMNTDGVVKAALLNAGWRPSNSVQSWINRDAFEEDVLEEMSSLFQLLRESGWTNGHTVFEKPTFGNHKHILPGEGDFIVDDLLVDIKTTKNPTFTKSFWRQLFIYYLLNDIQRVLYDINGRTYGKEPFDGKYPQINRVGIYFARYGELKSINISNVIDDQDRYEDLRAWIVNRAIEENRHKQHNYSAIRGALTEPYDYERQQTLSDF